MTIARIPPTIAASYRAARHLYASGPLTQAELFTAVNCGQKPSGRVTMLNDALRNGWLIEVDGKIDIGSAARAYFDDAPEPEAVEPTGQVATARTSSPLHEQPSLSRKYMPSSKGTRDDVPVYSVRDTPSFRSVGGQP